MSLKLTVKDYQIIKQASLEFKPGFTAIVGPSNNGKSSLIKALKSAVYTESGTTPIRNGADSYLVAIQKDGHTVAYQKKEGNTKYIVDGKTFSKFGLTTPEEVSNALNMRETILNGNKIQLNFWDQMDKPFLLDKSGGDLFKYIVDSGENDQLSSVLKSMVSDRQALNREADTIQGSIISIEKVIEQQENELSKSEETLKLADKLIDEKENYEEYKELKTLVDNYKEVISDLEKEQQNILLTIHNFNIYNSLNYTVKEKIKEINEIRDEVKKWNSLNLDFHNEQENLENLNTYSNILDKINSKELLELKSLIDSYKVNLEQIENVSQNTLMLQKSIPEESFIEKFKEYLNITANVNLFNDKIAELKVYEDGIKKYDEDILKLDEIRKSIKVCPLCGQKIGGEHVHRENIS